MTELQKYLVNGGSLEELKNDPYNLKIHYKEPFYIFKYNQINSDFNEPIVCESRGIILHEENWEIACNPFPKFFNLGESYSADIDLSKSKVYRKYDGSLIKIWYDRWNEKWMVSTNGMIDAKDADLSEKSPTIKTFYDLVIDVLGSEVEFIEMTSRFPKDSTYLFELLHPQNIIVEEQKDKKLILIGVRHNFTGADFLLSNYDQKTIDGINNVELCKCFDINRSFDIFKEFIEQRNKEGEVFEGLVVAEINNEIIRERVKMKSTKYFEFNPLYDRGYADNLFIDVFLNNEFSEFELYIKDAPEYAKDRYAELKDRFFTKISELERKVEDWYGYFLVEKRDNPENYKSEFGMEVQAREPSWMQGFIFEFIYNDREPMEVISTWNRDKLKTLLGTKDE